MLLIALLILVIIVDQYCERKVRGYNNDGWPTFVSGAILVIGLFIFLICKTEHSITIQTYNQTKEIYDHQLKNENISGEERAKLMDFCINTNEEILNHRKHYKNIFIGVFASKKIANLELLDFTKLPQPKKG